jgi:hypothetical protein
MSNTIRKISAIGLSVSTAVWLSGAAMVLPVASAATIEELQAQIASLLAQIQALQAQLASAQGAAVTYSFTRDLTLGSTGDDVKALQQFLNSKGFTLATSGAGSPGNETAYFGSRTQAALAKYQASVGISPAAGYFGPKTRAYVASLAAAPTTPTLPTPPTAPGVPTAGLAVALASDNPAAGSLISGASRVNVLKVTLTAGTAGAATINGIKFTKTGVLSDTAINNAYLVEGGKVIAQYSSISGGVITFSGLNLSIDAGKSRDFALGIDTASGLTAGNTVAFSLNAAGDVTAVDSAGAAITLSGAFPMNGNTQTITSVSNPSLATLTIASSTVGTTVYAGTQNVLVSQWTVTAANSKVNLSSLKFSVVGSAAKSDIQNVKLMVNGIQVGSTLASVAADGSAYFDLSSSPASLSTGSSNMQVYADIMGSPGFNFDFGILNTFDVYAIDTTYNTPVAVTVTGGSTGSASGHQITINQGAITVSAASDTPTGNIARGGSGTTLAKFTIYAAGEAVKVKYLDFKLTFTGTTGTISNIVKNISLVDNVGGQVGSTISTPGGTTNACAQGNTGWLTTTAFGDCFGTSSSPINYIVPANTTRVLSLKADIQTTAAFTTVTAALSGNTSNLQGMTSSQSASSGSASGAAMTLVTTPLTVARNAAVGNPTYALGAANVRIGSYVLSASSAEGVNISNLTVAMSASSTDFQNLLVKVGNVQFGSTKSTLSASDVVTFSGGTTIAVPAGGSAVVDVYADVLSGASAGTKTTLTTLSSCVGTGASTYTSISCSPTSVAGQNVIVASGSTLTVAISSATAPAKQVVMGSANNSLATFRFAETAGVESIKITKLIVTAVSPGASVPSFENVKIYSGTSQVGGPVSASSTVANNWAFVFNFATAPIVPQGGALELEIKGDAATYASQGAVSNGQYTFRITSINDVTALGSSPTSIITVSGITPVTGNTLTVLRTKLTLSSTTLGSTSDRTRTAYDDLATLTFTADPAYSATLNTITLKFQGMAVSTGTVVTANLIDPGTGADWQSGSSSSCTTTSNSCSLSFAYTGANIPTISGSKQVKVRVNSGSFYNAAQTSDSLTVSVDTAASVNWGDSVTTAGLNLEASAVPLVVSSVSYE